METKTCRICGEEKLLSEMKKGREDKYRNECKKCFQGLQRKSREKVQEFIANYKIESCCSICGENRHPSVLEFHHLDPSEKDEQFFRNRGWGFKRWESEIEKCVILCANCHRLVHSGYIEL